MKNNIRKLSILLSGLSLIFTLLIKSNENTNIVEPVYASSVTRFDVDGNWQPWSEADDMPTQGFYYLTNDITLKKLHQFLYMEKV